MGILSKIASKVLGSPEERAHVAYKMGLESFEENDLVSAEYHFKTAKNYHPEKTEYLLAYGNVLFGMGDFAGAAREYELAASTDKESAILYSNWGIALRLLGDTDRATAVHKRAVELAPDDVETLMNAAATFVTSKDNNEARLLLEKVISLDKEHGAAHYHMAHLIWESGTGEEMLDHINFALTNEEQAASMHLLKGAYLFSQSKNEEAETSIKTALEIDPEVCSEVELKSSYAVIKEQPFYREFLANKPNTMYTYLTDAECVGEMAGVKIGEKKHLLVLAFAKHGVEARDKADEILKVAGWGEYTIDVLAPAHREGLAGQGQAVMQGWELAEQNGAHIFIF